MKQEFLLGIDTGGTYTDGVLLEKSTRRVVSTAKTPTTHHDLKVGILKALQALIPEQPAAIRLVAISTTLATNAIAEGKGRPVGLLLLGYDPELVGRFEFASQFGTPKFHYIDGGHDLHGRAQRPLARQDLQRAVSEMESEVDALAVSGYFSPFNPEHELLAFKLIREQSGLPVVLGHQLSSRLNSIQRATTATLNASLLAILQEFIEAIQSSMGQWQLGAPLMVVRGDGALMAQATALDKPVETVHSGPAASAIGGKFLAEVQDAVVIDVGGTTTDIALIKDGRVQVRESGTSVGDYSTSVRAASIRSIGLGGDSLIEFDIEDQVAVGPARVLPICRLAAEFPEVAREVGRLRMPQPDQLEYWFLAREPSRWVEGERTQQLVEQLSKGPQALPRLLERMELLHPIQFGASRLLRSGVIGRAGLTPTDLFHVTGEYSPWDQSAAQKAVWAMAQSQGLETDDFISMVRYRMAKMIAVEVISFISDRHLEFDPKRESQPDLGSWLFNESLDQENPFMGAKIFLKVPLVGIGAPAKLLLPKVAEMLQAELIIPPHFEVANAIGAVAGSITASQEAWIYPQMRGRHIGGYFVQAASQRDRFATLSEAQQFAKERCRSQALEQAKQSGAVDPQVTAQWLETGAESYRLLVQASGAPALG